MTTASTTITGPEPQGLTPEEAFREVDALLTEFPELHYQGQWESDRDPDRCGTTRCVAGWAVWVQARALGLLTRKRDLTTEEVRRAVAASVGVSTAHYPNTKDHENFYEEVGAAILGLSEAESHKLFWDMNATRVAARVASYALTGADLCKEERTAYDFTD